MVIKNIAAMNPGNFDPEHFHKEIAPLLSGVSASEIARVTGLLKPYCGAIRKGRRIPHPRHWSVLADLSQLAVLPEGA